ncbi:hypothetical protein RB195_016937 [Necator americanus]|uniref:Uncharacterized protein n=1 Tax=Necator americanus TaxID=51031 RepID=A0ABR1C5C2_NECAM
MASTLTIVFMAKIEAPIWEIRPLLYSRLIDDASIVCSSQAEMDNCFKCESQVLSIESGPSNESNVVYLEFSHVLIQQQSHTSCNVHEIIFNLHGTLVYPPRSSQRKLEVSASNAGYLGNNNWDQLFAGSPPSLYYWPKL